MRGELETIQDLYDRGLYARAFELATALGSLGDWRDVEGRVLAGRLANVLGANRLGRAIHARAAREAPDDAKAQFYGWLSLWNRCGTYAAFRSLQRRGRPPRGPRKIEAYWYAGIGRLYAMLRDFEQARRHLEVAESLAPEEPWIWVDRSSILDQQDRRDEAADAARRALELRPWYPPAIHNLARIYCDLNRRDDAIELVQSACAHCEAGSLWSHLAHLQTDARDGAGALQSLERAVAAYRLCEPALAAYLAGMRSDAAYLCGDRAAAIAAARESKSGFYLQLADRLEQAPSDARLVRLQVPFVRQHDVTCVPATLTMICQFWKLPVDHLQLADEICFNGTPHHVRRRWAMSQGLVVRDFTLTWDAAVALLDAGLPFMLTTVDADNSHMQAVVGYDEARRTLLIHDPGHATETECAIDPFLERQAAHGPGASVMAPAAEAERLDALPLPDVALQSEMHELAAALDEHRHPAATACVARLEEVAPDHPETWRARLFLSRYDGDSPAALAAVDRLLARFPNDGNLQTLRYSIACVALPRDERLDWLEELCQRPETDPALWQRYAAELRRDARTHREAERWLRKSLRHRPIHAPTWHALAGLRWSQERRQESTEFYRVATCVERTSSYLVDSYFRACRFIGEADDALALLRERFELEGHRAAAPACSLSEALEASGHAAEALEVLTQAVSRRADDRELMLFAADANLRYGALDVADDLHRRAAGGCRESAWLAMRAELLECRDTSLSRVLSAWREVTAREPAQHAARTAIARLLAVTSTRRAPLEYLDRLAARMPDDYSLACLQVEWLQSLAPQRVDATLRDLIARFPEYAWARRELVEWLVSHDRYEEAIDWAWSAVEIDASDAVSFAYLGRALAAAGYRSVAADALREALRLDIDNAHAADQLFHLHDTPEWRRDTIALVHQELARQTTFGDGLLTYQRLAVDVVDHAETLLELRTLLSTWPNAWQAWIAVARQLIAMNRLDAGIEQLNNAVRRFPLFGVVWYELARHEATRENADAERAALEQALQIAPRTPRILRALGDRLQKDGDLVRARALLARAVAQDPLDGINSGYLADALWQAERREEARVTIVRAIEWQRDYPWAWRRLIDWFTTSEEREQAIDIARRIVRRRKQDTSGWATLAELYELTERNDEALAVLAEGLRVNPRAADLYDDQARILATVGRIDEALAACQAAAWNGDYPINLRGRAAWIHERAGNRALAIEQMQGVLADAPDYVWGWYRLVGWYYDDGAQQPYLDAARRLVELEPASPMAHGNLAAAWLRLHRAGLPDEANNTIDPLTAAKQALRRSVELDEDYDYGHQELFELGLAEGDLEGAAESLAHLERIDANDPATIARKVQLSAARDDLASGGAALMLLLKQPLPYDWPLDRALAALEDLPGGPLVCEGFLGAAAEQQAEPAEHVVRKWVGFCQRTHGWGTCVRRLRRWRGTEASYNTAADELLILMGKNSVAKLLRWFVWRNRRRLAADNHLWARVGWALISTRRNRAARRWMADWQSRPDLETWPLLLVAISLYAEGNVDEAALANRRALELPRDEFAARHAVLLAGEELVVGNIAAARSLLPASEELKSFEYYAAVACLVWAALQIQDEFAGGKRVSAHEARRRLAVAVRQAPAGFGRDSAFDLLWHRLLWRIGTDQGHWLLAVGSRVRAIALKVDIFFKRKH